MSKSKEGEAAASILSYLEEQNRPYSATDIFNNLHKEHGKTVVVRCLEQLAANNQIKEKTYGKQKVYVADQSKFQTVSDAELKSMDDEISKLTKEFEEAKKTLKSLESEMNVLGSSLTTEQANEELVKTNDEVKTLEDKLRNLESNVEMISPEEKKSVCEAFVNNVTQWRKRKRIVREIVDSIMEGYPKTKKCLYEEVGIETDEDVSVKVPELN